MWYRQLLLARHCGPVYSPDISMHRSGRHTCSMSSLFHANRHAPSASHVLRDDRCPHATGTCVVGLAPGAAVAAAVASDGAGGRVAV